MPQYVMCMAGILALILAGCANSGKLGKSDKLLATETIPVWPGNVPGARSDLGEEQTVNERIMNVQVPTMTVFLPPADRVTSTSAVLIYPGGGYEKITVNKEGTAVAEWFRERGVAAFVLKYRLKEYGQPWPLLDAQRALRTIRMRAREWRINPDRIGVMGFSAGGHLASSTGTHFAGAEDPLDSKYGAISARPDFMILLYPVVTMEQGFSHGGSRKNLLGENPSEELVAAWSNERHVTPDTPPAFIVHGADDKAVPIENSLRLYEALRRAGVPAELHAYEHGPHGIGMANDPKWGPISTWPDRMEAWLRARRIISTSY